MVKHLRAMESKFLKDLVWDYEDGAGGNHANSTQNGNPIDASIWSHSTFQRERPSVLLNNLPRAWPFSTGIRQDSQHLDGSGNASRSSQIAPQGNYRYVSANVLQGNRAAVLREDLKKGGDWHRELYNSILRNSKLCQNPTFTCNMTCLDGFDHCIRHILRDPKGNGKYAQCCYMYANGRRCVNAFLKPLDPDEALLKGSNFCTIHRYLMHAETSKAFVKVDSNDALLHNLARHINVDEMQSDNMIIDSIDQEDDFDLGIMDPFATPFIAHEQIQSPTKIQSAIKNDRLQDVTPNEGPLTFGQSQVRQLEWYESEDEMGDEDEENDTSMALKYAGVYTEQEVASIYVSKLKKLQSGYNKELEGLKQTLSRRRRFYLQELQAEKSYGSIHAQALNTVNERKQYKEFLALKKFHTHTGIDALIRQRFRKKQQNSRKRTVRKGNSKSKCIYVDGTVKCYGTPMPCTKYCFKHIIYDPKQVLYQPCGIKKGDNFCREPIIPIGYVSACPSHFELPPKSEQYAPSKFNKVDTFKKMATDELKLMNDSFDEKTQNIKICEDLRGNNWRPNIISGKFRLSDVSTSLNDGDDE